MSRLHRPEGVVSLTNLFPLEDGVSCVLLGSLNELLDLRVLNL